MVVDGEKVVPKQTPGVTPGGRERGWAPSQGREEALVRLASWSCGRSTDTVWRAARERESTDWSSSQQPAWCQAGKRDRDHHINQIRDHHIKQGFVGPKLRFGIAYIRMY